MATPSRAPAAAPAPADKEAIDAATTLLQRSASEYLAAKKAQAPVEA